MRTSLLTVVVGFLISISAFAQPLEVDEHTLALWNFNDEPAQSVLDSSPNGVHGFAANTLHLDNTPINMGKARYFRDHTAAITFPFTGENSPVYLANRDEWSIEFMINIDRYSPDVRNIFNNGFLSVELHNYRVVANLQRLSNQYGVRTEKQLNGFQSYRVSVIFKDNELAIFVDGKIWASQSLDQSKFAKSILNPKLPIQVGGVRREPILDSSLGRNHACLTGQIGGTFCWGLNQNGQMGIGVTGGTLNIPQRAVGFPRGTLLSAGESFTCGYMQGAVYCWGSNENFALGVDVIAQTPFPLRAFPLVGVTAIDSGSGHSCALTGSGAITCWGKNSDGQLGLGFNSNGSLPTQAPGLTGVQSISLGANHTCAILTDKTVHCWGSNSHQQLGHSGPGSAIPLQVPGISNAVKLALGSRHSCVLQADNQVKCWGANELGQAGIGSITPISSPSNVLGLGSDVVTDLSSGLGDHTCAVLQNKRVKCWGSNNANQLGLPITISSSPMAMDAGIEEAKKVVLSEKNTCVLRFNTLACLGSNEHGMRAQGTDFIYSNEYLDPVWAFRQGFVYGYLDDIRISSIARRIISRPVLTSLLTPDVNTANPEIHIQVESSIDIAGETLTASLNGSPVSGLSWDGTKITGFLNRPMSVGHNSLEASVEDVTGNVGKLRISTRVLTAQENDLPYAVVAGGNNACYITGTGDVYCWGSNQWGQLGTDTNRFSSSPLKNQWLKNIKQIAISSETICALDSRGGVSCLGSNNNGALGNNSSLRKRSHPEPLTFLKAVTKIVAGPVSFCAIHGDRSLSCWGGNWNRSLRIPADSNFEPVYTDIFGVDDVSIGKDHSCYLRSGSVYCMGQNFFGQVGDGTNNYADNLIKVTGIGTITSISAGNDFTCARNTQSRLWCWGSNYGAQFGTGKFPPIYPVGSRTPIEAHDDFKGTNVLTGDGFTCSKQASGSFKCWGANEKGEIGNGTFVHTPYGHEHSGFQSLDVRDSQVCGIDSARKVFCWGSNSIGQSGAPIDGSVVVPTEVIAHPTVIPILGDVTAGEGNTCLKKGNDTFCWGSTSLGQLGQGESTRVLEKYPQKIYQINDITQTSVGYSHICHVTSGGKAFCSGGNAFYQSGTEAPFKISRFNEVFSADVKKIVAGETSTCALKTNGTVWCLGNNLNGQLGNGSTIDRSSVPVQVTIDNVSDLYMASRGAHACAIKSDSTVWCWGANGNCQSSEENCSNLFVPTELRTLKNSIKLALTQASTCGLSSTGKAACSRANIYGQAGAGNTFNNTGWHPVYSNKSFNDLKGGTNHVCALDVNKDLYCWGRNHQGQVGNGSTSPAVTFPQKVFSNVRDFFLGGDHTCAVTEANKLACWGFNGNAQFGNGSITNSSIPSFSDISKINGDI